MFKISKKSLILITIPIILFIMLLIAIKANINEPFELYVYEKTTFFMNPKLTEIIKFITHLGDAITVILITLLLLLIPKTRIKYGVLTAITIIFTWIDNLILKHIFSRERPNILQLVNETSYSFPSGHAMINAALYTMLTILVIKNVKCKYLKIALISLFIVVTILIGFSRIYLGVHYFTDVLAGYILGFLEAFIIYKIFTKGIIKLPWF